MGVFRLQDERTALKNKIKPSETKKRIEDRTELTDNIQRIIIGPYKHQY
jgi:hypothetical protein